MVFVELNLLHSTNDGYCFCSQICLIRSIVLIDLCIYCGMDCELYVNKVCFCEFAFL